MSAPLQPLLLGLLVLSSVPVLAQSAARRRGQGLGLGLLPTEEENGELVTGLSVYVLSMVREGNDLIITVQIIQTPLVRKEINIEGEYLTRLVMMEIFQN